MSRPITALTTHYLPIAYCLLAPQRCQALRRVEIGEDGGGAGFDLGNVLGMAIEQRARAVVTGERHELGEKAA